MLLTTAGLKATAILAAAVAGIALLAIIFVLERDDERMLPWTSGRAEHLDDVAFMLGIELVDPQAVRRNIVVRGINLLALKDKRFSVGDTMLESTGLCHPCSRMEVTLGPGGYNALRGHGGITARVVRAGIIGIGDAVGIEC